MSMIPNIPVGHVDDAASMGALFAELRALHGSDYNFALFAWDGPTMFRSRPGKVTHAFMVRSDDAALALRPGDAVRGPGADGPYRATGAQTARVEAEHTEALRPGDVVTVGAAAAEPADADSADADTVTLDGRGLAFMVTVAASGYTAPRLALLRNLGDFPGGCAAYPGAFRREALPPDRSQSTPADARGVNRVNEHTLDMRMDREPPPIRHFHGPVTAGAAGTVNHSETAIVLPRTAYGLPEIAGEEHGHLLIYPDPAHAPRRYVRVPVRPGSFVVTPATAQVRMGHCFENVFAMLVAIPGFVAPYHMIEE